MSTGPARRPMRAPAWPPLAALLAALALSACAGEDRDLARQEADHSAGVAPDAFRAELRGGRTPGCPLRGNAVYLGEGRFLTAAHLVDDIVPQLRNCNGSPIPTTIRYAGRVLTVRPLRVGKGYIEPGIGPLYRDGADLALLQSTFIPPGPAARPCGSGPEPGQAVLVFSNAHRGGTAQAGARVPEVRAADGAYADIAMPLAEGESGAGVFDAGSHCLLGIVSHRPDASPNHARIVPADTIRAFLEAPQGEAARNGPPQS